MYKRFRYMILMAILLSGALQALAQFAMPDKVCVGTNRRYNVIGLPGSFYTWKIDGVIQNSIADSIYIDWLIAGNYNLEVQEHQADCVGDVQAGLITVIAIPQLDVQPDVESCVSYFLPTITGTNLSGNEAYYDNSQALGGKKITGPITSSQKVWIYDYTSLEPNCSDETSFNIVIIIPPLAFAGSPATICPENAYTLLEATAENYSALLWASAGDGIFDNDTILHSTYTPGAADLQAGFVTLTFTASGLGKSSTCAPAVSTVTLTIIKLEAALTSTDVTCFGANNGTITISELTGGNYEYNIGTGWAAFTAYLNLTPGNYQVQMRDAITQVCVITIGNIEIKQPDQLSALSEFTDASCFGNDGIISVTEPKGGSGSYEYALNGTDWTSSGYFTQLLPGTYIVRISDANVPDCEEIVGTIIIKLPEPLTATVSQINVSCFAGNDGSITVSGSKNGSGAYEYSIDGSNWIPGSVFSNLNAGTYTVQMRDLNAINCVETIASLTITEPEQLQATASSINVKCFRSKDGSISILNTTGGSGSFEFTIDGIIWSNSVIYSNLGPGTYDVLMRDLAVPDCVVSVDKILITEPLQLAAVVASTDITCYGSNDGTLTITDPANGLPNYQYTIDGTSWIDNGIFTGLGPDSYIVQMRDANGCKDTLGTIQIIEPLPLFAEVDSTNATCVGNDGTITISNPVSGSGFYEYTVSGTNWVADGVFTGLAPNTYIVKLRDARLITCERTIKTVKINATEALKARAVKTNVTCFGANDGMITITNQQGGSGLYEYSVDGTIWISLLSVTDLAPAKYTLQMRDANANNCLFTVGDFDITEPVQLSATATPTDVTCFDGNDGSINMTAQLGGSGNYEYSVNGTDWFIDKIENLPAGYYTVQMRDVISKTCILILDPVEIKQPEKLMATVTSSDVTCFGGSDGILTISDPENGSGNYEYRLNGVAWTAGNLFDDLVVGIYSLEIRDALATTCMVLLGDFTISQPDKLEATATGTNETIPGANDGTLAIIGQAGGTGEYEYSIDGISWQPEPAFADLASGKYTVWVRDANKCTLSLPVEILPAGSITAEFTSTDVTCYGNFDGSITFGNATGTTNYEYSIFGGAVWQSNEFFGGLTANSYTIMVRDADSPVNSAVLGVIEIKQPTELQATITTANETFAGASDGIITIIAPQGGSGVYEYSIDGINWVTNAQFAGLQAQTYFVQIRDKNAPFCIIIVQKVIQPAGSLSADVSNTHITCNGSNNGSITISNVSGGSGNFEYSINNGVDWQTSGNYTGLVAGIYDIMLRDANTPANTISLGKVSITQPPKLIANLYNFAPSLCAGGSGTFTISASGGISPYKGTGDFSLPAGGTKKYTISDANGCTAEILIQMLNPDKVIATGVVILPKCFGEEGTVTITATGGTGALKGEGTFKVQAGKTYNFKVTDNNGCQSNVIGGQMPVIEKLVVLVTPIEPLCSGTNNTVKVTAKGGTPPYIGEGNFYKTTGIYTFTVTDANGCSSDGTIDISLHEPPVAPIASVTVQPTCTSPTGTIKVTEPKAGTGFEYSLDGGLYQSSAIFAGLAPLSIHNVKVKEIATSCESGLTSIAIGSVSNPPLAPSAQVIVLPTCIAPKGTIEVTEPKEGTGFEYSLDGGSFQASAIFDNLATLSNHTIKVKDISTGCVSNPTSIAIGPITNPPLAPTVGVTVQPICLTPTGTIVVSVPKEGTGFEYSRDGLPYQASATFSGLTPGSNHTIRIKDIVTGCESGLASIAIGPISKGPATPTASVTVQPICMTPTGTIVVSVPKEETGFEYSRDGLPYQSSATFAGLAPGSNHIIRVKEISTGCESGPASIAIGPISKAPAAPIASVTKVPTCFIPTGTIEVTSPIGSNYQYSFDGDAYQSNTIFENLVSGSSHTINVKDISTGCESLGTIIRMVPLPLNPAAPEAKVTVNPTCSDMNGTVEVTRPTGADFEYNIDGGAYQASVKFEGLGSGTHILKVINIMTGCESAPGNVEVPAIPPAPVLTIVAKEDSKCFGDEGSISFNVPSAPDGVYTIKYDGGQFSNVSFTKGIAKVAALAGTYNNLTFETNGCSSGKNVNVIITQPSEIVITESIVEIDYKSQSKGAISLTVSGGTGPYLYAWSDKQTTKDIKDLLDGIYTVWVTDKNNCVVFKTIVIPIPNYPPIAVDDKFNAGCSAASGNLLYNDNGNGLDSDPEKDPFYIDTTPVQRPAHGTLTLNTDGTFEYMAAPGFSGIEVFSYAIYDAKHYQGDTATVSIIVDSDFDCDLVMDDLDPDADGDGILNVDEGDLTTDTDGDGHPNWLDIDADNDGIVDNFELQQSTPSYIAPSGIDTDGDGVDDAYDIDNGGTKLVPVDTDKDEVPDFLDADSDDDLVADYIEGHDANADGKPDHILSGKDLDSDGLDDAFDTVNRFKSPRENMTGSNAPMQDFDGDGKNDWRDDNDDDDAYLTRFEDLNADGDYSNDDMDFDGHPEYLDYGRDCDLFIPDAFSPNGDNVHEYFQVYCIDQFPNAKIYIFDQLGNKLFEKEHYGNLVFWGSATQAWWDGRTTNRSATVNKGIVTPGTYFYVLQLGNGEVKKSFVFVSY